MLANLFILLLLSLHGLGFIHKLRVSVGWRLSVMPSRVAIDYGTHKIGVAISDQFGNIKPHLKLINSGNMTETSIKIIDVAYLYHAKEIIVGIPTGKDRRILSPKKIGMNALCYTFATVLSATAATYGRFVIKAVDENYTTREAMQRSIRGDYRGSLDSVAAACLLEHYIADRGEMSRKVRPTDLKPGHEKIAGNKFEPGVGKSQGKEINEKIVKLVERLPSNANNMEITRHDKHVEFFKWFHRAEGLLRFPREAVDFSDPSKEPSIDPVIFYNHNTTSTGTGTAATTTTSCS